MQIEVSDTELLKAMSSTMKRQLTRQCQIIKARDDLKWTWPQIGEYLAITPETAAEIYKRVKYRQ